MILMSHDLGADLDELVLQRGQGPVFDSLRQGQRPQDDEGLCVQVAVGQKSNRRRSKSTRNECLLEPQE